MKGKELSQSRNKRGLLLCMAMAACLTLTGCAGFGPRVLTEAVIQYDASVLQSEQQVLLLNIIRMHDDQPPHFTVTSGITAQFTLTHTGQFGPTISGSSATNAYSGSGGLTLTKTVSDSPTISIAPMQGEKFAQRLLKPVDPALVNTILLQEGRPMIDKMLRLVGADFFMMGPEKTKTTFESLKDSKGNPLKDFKGEKYKYSFPTNLNDLKDKGLKDKRLNDWKDKEGFEEDEARCLLGDDSCYMENKPPSVPLEGSIKPENIPDTEHYKLFRKVVLHIKAMALSGRLQIFPLYVDVPNEDIEGTSRTITEVKKDSTKDTIDTLEKQYHWQEMPKSATQEHGFILTKRYPITALTDFDFAKMKPEDQKKLLKTIQKDLELNEEIGLGEGMIIVLLRGDKDNRWPIYGLFTLRNFRQVLQFLAESVIKNQPGYASEYPVDPSQFTKDLGAGSLDNPPLTLTINSGRTPPGDRLVDVDYNGKTYWISSQTAMPRWDKEVFSMLYEIFQFNNVTPAVSTPSLSIPTK